MGDEGGWGGAAGDLPLYPRPRHLRALGGRTAVPDRATAEVDPGLPAEGFRLEVTPAGAVLHHRDANGRRYGEATLGQLRALAATGDVPALEVRDWPDVPVRGFMLDVSRDRVPTRETLTRLVEVLATARFNHLQLYVEHTFAYRDHEVVWAQASPLTPGDVRWLDGVCDAAGIELAANQNCFGHMERWLRHDAYRHRAECPDGFELLPGMTMPPATLAPTAENAAFVAALLDELLPNFHSRRVNVGCDETFELGRCASAADAAAAGRASVYIEHLARIVGPLAARGYDVQFWADTVQSHPELLARLPAEGVSPVVWTYEAPRPDGSRPAVPDSLAGVFERLGIDPAAHAGFAAAAGPLRDTGRPFWLAPGTSSWNSLVGRLDNASANLLDACEVAVDTGAAGVLVTDWGDNGHLQPPSVSVLPIVLGGAMAWCLDRNRDLDAAAAANRWVFEDPTGGTGRALDRLGRLSSATGQRAFNGSPLFAGLCPHRYQFVEGEPDADALAGAVDGIEAALADLAAARPACVDGATVVAEVANAARLARHGAWRLRRRAGATAPSRGDRRADLAALVEEYRACWLARSRPGGLDDSAGNLERTLATYDR